MNDLLSSEPESADLSQTELLEVDHPAVVAHAEYVADRGVYQDMPFDEIMATFAEIYPGVTDREDADFDPALHVD